MTEIFFAFLGGLALLLYGMQLMSDGLQKVAEDRLQRLFEVLAGRIVYGVILGTFVAAILQSSGITTIMTVSMVNAGLMTLKQAFGIVMGANIGTTVTAQLIAFKVTDFVTVFLALGFGMNILATKKKMKFTGQILLGFGIMMLGMQTMGNAVAPLRQYPGFVDFIQTFAENPLIGLLVGTVMTCVVQSSTATIGILMAMAGQGLIPLEGAIPVMLGDNVGTCITSVLASLRANRAAKRVAYSHVLYNLIGSIIFIIFMSWFIKFVLYISPEGDIARQIANSHTAFNLLSTIIFLPIASQFVAFVEMLVPGKDKPIARKAMFLDENMLSTSALAMPLASKEVVRMGNMAWQNVKTAIGSIADRDAKKIEQVLENEPIIDFLETEITKYLTQMSEKQMTPDLAAVHTGLLHACNDIERIGDHAETIAKKVRSMREEDVVFSEIAYAELEQLGALVLDASSKAIKALETNDRELAQASLQVSREVKILQKAIRKNHVQRLNDKICKPGAGFVMLELLLNMKRISDHSKNISQLVLGEF
ncbi:MAG TPA: Na/Pi cotransporter family protein [Candidatus Avacidaminococcus intestinavium]|uniref:Na/Pi cotransporter family protein n=1 Tax=Candidatus Avacidaminococcus intestinavium TaxID=2840684 RepID=A0A9D1MQX0_9FIRM|nr:Na/Pi cotransporter family protein [Candidatus Avacidaminococcus intestinavium]